MSPPKPFSIPEEFLVKGQGQEQDQSDEKENSVFEIPEEFLVEGQDQSDEKQNSVLEIPDEFLVEGQGQDQSDEKQNSVLSIPKEFLVEGPNQNDEQEISLFPILKEFLVEGQAQNDEKKNSEFSIPKEFLVEGQRQDPPDPDQNGEKENSADIGIPLPSDCIIPTQEELDLLEDEIPLGGTYANFLFVSVQSMDNLARVQPEPLDEKNGPADIESNEKVWQELNKYNIKPNYVSPVLALRLAKFIEKYPLGLCVRKFEKLFCQHLGYKPYLGDAIFSFRQMVIGETRNDIWPAPATNKDEPEKDRNRDIFFTLEHLDILHPKTRHQEQIVFPNFNQPCLKIKQAGSLDYLFKIIWKQILQEKRRITTGSVGPFSVNQLWEQSVKWNGMNKDLFSNWGTTLNTFTWICCRLYTTEYRKLNTKSTNGETFIELRKDRIRPKKFEEPERNLYQDRVPEICAQLGDEVISISDAISPNEVHEVIDSEVFSSDSFGVRKMSYYEKFAEWDAFVNQQIRQKEICLIQANPNLVTQGLYVMVYCRNAWNRGLVYLRLKHSYFSVYLIDWAGWVNLSWINIHYMPNEFLVMPAFGIWCRLAQNDDFMKKHELSNEDIFSFPRHRHAFKNKFFRFPFPKRCVYAFKFIEKIEYMKGISCWRINFCTIKPCIGKAGCKTEETYDVCIEAEDVHRWLYENKPDGPIVVHPLPDTAGMELVEVQQVVNNFAHLPPKRDKSLKYEHFGDCLNFISSLDPSEQNHFIGLNSGELQAFEEEALKKLKKKKK